MQRNNKKFERNINQRSKNHMCALPHKHTNTQSLYSSCIRFYDIIMWVKGFFLVYEFCAVALLFLRKSIEYTSENNEFHKNIVRITKSTICVCTAYACSNIHSSCVPTCFWLTKEKKHVNGNCFHLICYMEHTFLHWLITRFRRTKDIAFRIANVPDVLSPAEMATFTVHRSVFILSVHSTSARILTLGDAPRATVVLFITLW